MTELPSHQDVLLMWLSKTADEALKHHPDNLAQGKTRLQREQEKIGPDDVIDPVYTPLPPRLRGRLTRFLRATLLQAKTAFDREDWPALRVIIGRFQEETEEIRERIEGGPTSSDMMSVAEMLNHFTWALAELHPEGEESET